MAEGKLLPDAPFRVVRSQKLGMDHFFPSGRGSSEKEKRGGERKQMPPGTPAAGGDKEATREGKVGRHREKGQSGLAAIAPSSSTSNRNVGSGGAPAIGPGTSSSNLCIEGDAGRTRSGRGNEDAVGAAAPDLGSPKGSNRRLPEVAQEESGLHPSRSSHATAARKRPRDIPTSSPALKAERTVKRGWHDLTRGDASPSSSRNARKRQQRSPRQEER